MSNDLISRRALMSHIESERREWGEDYDAEQILGDIEDMPTAYDPDMVVERLEKFQPEMEQFVCGCILTDIIEVVKGGGANE